MSIVQFNLNDSGSTIKDNLNANFADLDTTKADLASPAFTGTPSLPTGTTAVTQSANNNSTKLATTAYVDNQVGSNTITIETTTGVTHSLTTTANQKVVVWAKGSALSSNTGNLYLKYDGTTKDAVIVDPSTAGNKSPFALMYTETPGAGTKNITVTGDGTGTLSNVVIIIMKIG